MHIARSERLVRSLALACAGKFAEYWLSKPVLNPGLSMTSKFLVAHFCGHLLNDQYSAALP